MNAFVYHVYKRHAQKVHLLEFSEVVEKEQARETAAALLKKAMNHVAREFLKPTAHRLENGRVVVKSSIGCMRSADLHALLDDVYAQGVADGRDGVK